MCTSSLEPTTTTAAAAPDARNELQLSFLSSFFLATTKAERLAYATETESAEQLVDAQAAEQAVDDAAEAEPVEQLADQAEDTAEQQADGGDDLEQRLGEQAPERVELLLGVGHVVELLLCVLDRLHDGGCELLERVGEGVLLRRRFAGGGSCFGGGGDVSVWVEPSDGTVAFLQDAVAFFDHRFDVFDELFFVQFILWSSVCFVHALWGLLADGQGGTGCGEAYICDVLADWLHLFNGLLHNVVHLLRNLRVFCLLELFFRRAVVLVFW